MEPDRMSRQQIEAKIAEINEKIANYPRWGAVLTAWNEERRALESALRRLDNGPQ